MAERLSSLGSFSPHKPPSRLGDILVTLMDPINIQSRRGLEPCLPSLSVYPLGTFYHEPRQRYFGSSI